MPALNGAMQALASLDKKDITVVKSFNSPPEAVRMVMEAVCILLEEKTDWQSAKIVLSQMDFVERLQHYNKDSVPDSILRKLKNYVNRDEFEPEFVGSKALAAKSLCMWCIAMNKYADVIKVVRPKKEKVKAMNAKLEADVARLKEKQDELMAVEEEVAKLRQECEDTQEKVAQLEQDIHTTQLRLDRAEQLIELLADEGIRWEETLEELGKSSEKIIGNVFLSAAAISYLGPFTGLYRDEMSERWTARCLQLNVPCADNFSLASVMGKPIEIREWHISGLPTDHVSIENGILATNSQRWPLLIDPQMQAHGWIKSMERENDLKIMRLIKPNTEGRLDEKTIKEMKETMRLLEACISNGKPLLIENIGETLDPSIDPVLRKNVFKTQDGRTMLRLGDQDISYDSHFRLYLTTKLPNPHYLPEICIKVNAINFTVTFAGLEEQLLGDVVKQEKPDVEQRKNELIVSMSRDKKLLEQTQNKILQLIADSSGNILDDVVLIETMQTSKATSRDISKRVEDSIGIEKSINEAREVYRAVARRGAILYFVVADMAGVDPMYQYSLVYIKRLFNGSIEASPQRASVEERCLTLTENITKTIYTNVCRGLFESHKAIFSFLIAASINRNAGVIGTAAWELLLRGAGIVERAKQPSNPDPAMLPMTSWDLITTLDTKLPQFSGFTAHITDSLPIWQDYITSPDIISTPIPEEYESRLDAFDRLLIIKALRPEKLMFAFGEYVRRVLGEFFMESPPVTMDTLYADSEARTPVIFVLSQGADLTNSLLKYARDKGYFDRTEIISLGQGQGPKAADCLEKAKISGNWVLLQNCHLAKSWMPALEKIVEAFREEKQINSSFRLFLTSMPADYFPVSVLQNGLKLTTEPPRGIRANLKRSYAELTDEQFADCSKPDQWRKLLFGLCFFHAVVQERRKFGPLGFNIRYEFNDSDLETSMTNLKMFLEEQEEVPWDAMLYLTGHINYGGRVTDDWDRKCLLSILKRFYTPDILEEGYTFSDSGTYYSLNTTVLALYRDYIDSLPASDSPELFGMHDNANISYQSQESEKIVGTILAVQPRVSTATGGKSDDDIVLELAKGLSDRLPEKLDVSTGHSDLFVTAEYGLIPSLSTVLLQETERFNRLLTVMARSLLDLSKAIKGEIVMSQDLDDMYFSVLNSQVPPNWKKVAYPSLKPLASWIKDLRDRVDFMRLWLTYGNPSCYWLSGFYFPQAFITGTLQTYSRRYKVPIDHVAFSFNVLDYYKEEVKAAPLVSAI
jgi:dynein heavy chain